MDMISKDKLDSAKPLPNISPKPLEETDKKKFVEEWKDPDTAKEKIQSLSNWWIDFLVEHADYLKKCVIDDKNKYGRISPGTLKMIIDFDNMKNNAEKRFNIDQTINIGQINNISLGMIAEKISESKKKIIDLDKDGRPKN
jgi:hypothetical protein